ncbi:hypothetical protein [Acetobacter syzygii]|nr:hypothetical protein [Acetobacter syzygii]
MTGNFNAGSNRLINVANGTANTDAATVDQLNGKANLSGGNSFSGNQTMSGSLAVNAASGISTVYDPGGQTSGAVTQYARLSSNAGGRGGAFSLYVQELVGSEFQGVLLLSGNPKSRFLLLSSAGRFTDSVLGDFAYTSDLANYQPKGDYATTQSLSAEAQTRASADGTLQTNINNEAATRTNADNALQASITAETQARITGDNYLNSIKANLGGGNHLTGTQAITDGNQFTTAGNYTSTSGQTYDTDLIKGTSPNGTEYQVALREYAGSHYSMLHYIYDGTNFSIYEMPQTAYNGGRLQCPAGTGAVTADLPFTDPNLRVQVFTATGVANGQVVSFPTVFRQTVAVCTQVISDGDGALANHNINEVTTTGFTHHGKDTADMYVIAYGYF